MAEDGVQSFRRHFEQLLDESEESRESVEIGIPQVWESVGIQDNGQSPNSRGTFRDYIILLMDHQGDKSQWSQPYRGLTKPFNLFNSFSSRPQPTYELDTGAHVVNAMPLRSAN